MSRKKRGAKNVKHRNSIEVSDGVRGLEREAHFASGGSLVEWRGIHKIHKPGKQSRRIQNQKAIKDSED